MTTVVYNGVVIQNCVTRQFDSETVYDQSGTDIIGRTIHFTWQGTLHSKNVGAGAPTFIDIDTVGRNDPARYKVAWMHGLLSVPRKRLSIYSTVTATPPAVADAQYRYFDVQPATPATINKGGDWFDSDNGPKPQRVEITQISNSEVFRVTFSITVQVVHCSETSGGEVKNEKSQYVVSNRWSVAESMDSNHFTTRRISGHIRFVHALTSAHAYRSLIMPPLENGFKREAVEFEELATGLEGTYTIVDRQVHTAAPWPCTHFEAVHEESTTDALQIESSLRVTCYGDPSTNKADLLARAIQIADARLDLQNPKRNYIYNHIAIVDTIGETNKIDLSISVRRYESTQRVTFDLMAKGLAQPLQLPPLAVKHTKDSPADPLYDPRKSRIPATFGYDPHETKRSAVQAFLLHCVVNTPCSNIKGLWNGPQHEPPAASAGTPPKEPDPKKTPVTGAIVPTVTPPPPAAAYSDGHAEAIYTACRMDSRYTKETVRCHLPLAFPRVAQVAGKDVVITAQSVALTHGVCRRIIRVDCERLGKPPLIPYPMDYYQDQGIDFYLLSHWVEPCAPTKGAGGDTRPIFRITAHYVYGGQRFPSDMQKLRVGTLPFTKFTPAQDTIDLASTYSEGVGP